MDEQALLRRLVVFVGGCALDAAEQVCRDAGATHDVPVGEDGAGMWWRAWPLPTAWRLFQKDLIEK